MPNKKNIKLNTRFEFEFSTSLLNTIHLRIINAEKNVHTAKTIHIKNHRRPFNVLYAVHSGTETYTNLNHSIVLKPDSLIFFPIYSNYEVNLKGPLSYSVLRFYADTPLGIDLFHSLGKAVKINEMYTNFNSRFNESILNPAKHLFALKALVYECCQNVLNATDYNIEKQYKMHDKYQAVLNGYKDNLQLKVQDIASKMNLSPSNLTTQFKKDMGMSISDYRNQLLVKKATTLLTGTNLFIRECAEKLGFSDELYFSRFFKKQIGLSPKNFREINKIEKGKEK